jgi:hypothetical protein
MATKKAKTTVAKTVPAAKPIAEEAKITVINKENPFREGTGVYKRAQAVLTSKKVADAIKKGARISTVRYLAKNRFIKLAA